MGINIQPLDMERRSHFQHLGENLWHGGDQFDYKPRRDKWLTPARQQLTVNIEQQDESMWWVLVDVGYRERPMLWMRKFVVSMWDAFHDILFDPLALVHRPLPDLEISEPRRRY